MRTADRIAEITRLRIRYRGYMLERKWRAATRVWVRLHDFMNMQLRAEIRQDAYGRNDAR